MNTVTSKDGTVLAYDIYGKGQPLIYITGATCFRTFKPIVHDAKIFGNEFAVYNFDRRGRGESGDTQPYSIEREIDDIEAMIDEAGGRALLYGHSSGAILALEAATKLKDKIEKIVVYEPPYVHSEVEQANHEKFSQSVLKLLAFGKHKQSLKAFLNGIGMPGLFVRLLPFFPGWKSMCSLAPTLAYDLELSKDFPPLEKFKEIQISTLVLVGSKSSERIRAVGSQIATASPHINFKEIAGQDHMIPAKVLLPIFTRFFNGYSLGG